MASVNINENEFDVLANAARTIFKLGDVSAAKSIDKIARKANAALTNDKYRSSRVFIGALSKSLTWKDVPSTLED